MRLLSSASLLSFICLTAFFQNAHAEDLKEFSFRSATVNAITYRDGSYKVRARGILEAPGIELPRNPNLQFVEYLFTSVPKECVELMRGTGELYLRGAGSRSVDQNRQNVLTLSEVVVCTVTFH